MLSRPRSSGVFFLVALVVALVIATALPASAQVAGPTNNLVDLTRNVNRSQYDDLERAAAKANQAAYNALVGICSAGPGPTCTVDQFGVFDEVREIVETANQILGNGPIANSLNLGDAGLAKALRWTAAEEVSAQSSSATKFSNGQLSSVKNRITALRYGARGFSLAGMPGTATESIPGLDPDTSLGTAGVSETIANLGGFLNVNVGWGTQDPTTFDDAFDYLSTDVTLGIDYRFRNDLVGGITAGYAYNEVDFDESKSVVSGGIDANGFSLGAFGVYSWRDFYASAFVSYQRMEFDIKRFITYPSFNPSVSGTNTRTKGDTASDAVSAAFNGGYTYRFGIPWFDDIPALKGKAGLIEPSFRAEITDIRIQGYDEKNVTPTEYFALRIREQDIQSVELSVGLRVSWAVSLPFGVFFPYGRVEWRFEMIDDTRETKSKYDGLGKAGAGVSPFALEGESIDKDYGVVVAGVQTILNAGRAMEVGGPITSRLSLFVEYRRILELEDISNQVIGAGLRYQF